MSDMASEDRVMEAQRRRCAEMDLEDFHAELRRLFVACLEERREAVLELQATAAYLLGRAKTPMNYRDYLKSKTWRERRQVALSRAKYQCSLCFRTKHLNVHHRTYDRLGREHDNDLIVLCRTCHARHHEIVQ